MRFQGFFPGCGTPPRIVGIVNVTPDSYFDGGRYTDENALAQRVRSMIAEGADIIDVGGESTGPHSNDVSIDEERARVMPAIDLIRSINAHIPISIDTWKSAVALDAIDHGATIVNDVTAGRGDPRMFDALSTRDCRIILMHAKDPTPRTTVQAVSYDDVIASVHHFLIGRIAEAQKAGVARERIIVDPGLGHFVSSIPSYSFEILARLRELSDLGPILVSPSRKSFLASPRNLPPSDRLPATIAATTIAALNGASFIRTHDVKPTHDALHALSQTEEQ